MENSLSKPKVLTICGSTRSVSTNLGLINAIWNLFRNEIEFTLLDGLADLPHFNPDLDNETPPFAIEKFRNKIRAFDGVLICTPEYAMGVPGTLKNALDWTVGSMEFSKKPVALITASSLGEKGHTSLLATLEVIESNIPESSRLLVSFVKTKVKGNEITDDATLEQVKSVIHSLIATIKP